MQQPKVFGIGFHKTATTSLAFALTELGYNVTGPNGTKDGRIAANLETMTAELSHRYDAFQDNPWPLVYRQMDGLHPGSKFILTTRDPQRWIASMVKHFGTDYTPMRELIYGQGKGAPAGHEQHYLDTMARHNDAVRAYFADRADDLLEIDLTAGHGWAPLCTFLGKEVPAVPFPHTNKASDRVDNSGNPAVRLRDAYRRVKWRINRLVS